MIARTGAPAPEFTTKAFHQGEVKTVSLADYRGKWVVLVFYPADFTFVCPCELASIAQRYDEFEALNTEVLAISIDTVYAHQAWHDAELAYMVERDGGIPYPMLSDLGGPIGMMYNVFDEVERVNLRGTFLIDPDGVVQAMQVLNADVGRSVDETLREIKAYQESRETGQVMPPDWEPGKKTLTPGADLIGKVHDVWKVGE
ncbi:MAG: thioredoxin-dependent peroxiredoxin [Anaerolineae bacterium]|nr:thioredoxin-dependent peroxiredoxin [Anaerolineae bacterium]